MSETTSTASLQLRNLQLLRALFAAIAAIMITFSGDHSALVGLRVFAGFAVATALAWFIAAWLYAPKGQRAMPLWLGAFAFMAGIAASANFATQTWYFILVVAIWAVLSAVLELFWQASLRKNPNNKSLARDELTMGILKLLLALALVVVPHDFFYEYFVKRANETFVLSGDILAVGIFGLYAAIVAVFLAISGFSPAQPAEVAVTDAAVTDAGSETKELISEEPRND